MPRIAQAERVELPELLEFIRPRHRAVLITTRSDGRPQSSPLSCGVDAVGRIVISTYPQRAKTANVRREVQQELAEERTELEAQAAAIAAELEDREVAVTEREREREKASPPTVQGS